MPALDYNPKAAISCGLDLTHLAGHILYQKVWHGGVSASVVASAGFGDCEDIYDLLHAQGSHDIRTLAAALNNATASGEPIPEGFAAYVNASDRVEISYPHPFSIRAAVGNPYGLDTLDVEAQLRDGVYVARAVGDWTRGTFLNPSYPNEILSFWITYSGSEYLAYMDGGRYQGVIQSLRDWSLSDTLTGEGSASLTGLEGRSAGSYGTRWILSDTGYVEYWTDLTEISITWASTELRDVLGYTGSEPLNPVADSGGYSVMRATYRPHGLLWLNRPVEYVEPRVRGTRRLAEATDGRVDTTHLATRRGWLMRFSIQGLASTEDATAEALDGFFAYLWKAKHFTLYQNTAEPRKAAARRDGYSLELCGEDNYRVGRIRLVLDPGIEVADFTLEDPRIRLRYFMELSGNEYIP
jgi:hypothetical protein